MGYRSDVAFCLSVDTHRVNDGEGRVFSEYSKDRFKKMVGFFKLTKFYELATDADNDCLKSKELGWQGGEILFHVQHWKWYPDYDIVKAFDEMWEQMQDIEDISGYFCRVGEGDGDEPDVQTEEFGDDPQYSYFGAQTIMYFNAEDTLGVTQTDEEK